MGKAFGDTHGSAIKEGEYYKFQDGANVFRMVGNILPRYVYWATGPNGQRTAIECLSFDRQKERFTNAEKDWYKHYFNDEKCQWSYLVNVIDINDGNKVKILGLKKKLFEQIKSAAEDIGSDPTDPVEGWPIHVKKVKTGPSNFNVEYQLQVLRCKPEPLTEEQLVAVAEAESIDNFYRPSAQEQKEYIEGTLLGSQESEDKEVISELEEDGKDPF